MPLRAPVSALLGLLFVGCSSITHTLGEERWFNSALPIHLQSILYEQEATFCAQAADQWIPLPKVRFDYSGVRLINGSPNVSVEGSSLGATVSQTQNSLVVASASSAVSIWETIGATSIQNHRESRERRNCMTALGWKPMNNTWDGTPAALNESIAVNRSVMTAVKDGYSHPLLGAGVVALIDMGESGFVDSEIVIHTTEIPLYATSKTRQCTYRIASGWWSRRTEVSCENSNASEIKIASTSPVARWLEIYF